MNIGYFFRLMCLLAGAFPVFAQANPFVPNFEDRYLRVESDVTIRYIQKGNPENPLILFLHGNPEYRKTWSFYLNELSDEYFTVAIDLPGVYAGWRPESVRDHGYKPVANVLVEFARRLGHEKFYLVGHDAGGYYAWGAVYSVTQNLLGASILNSSHPYAFSVEYFNNPAQQRSVRYQSEIKAQEPGNRWNLDFLFENDFSTFKEHMFRDYGVRNYFYENDGNKLEIEWLWRSDRAVVRNGYFNFYHSLDMPPPNPNKISGKLFWGLFHLTSVKQLPVRVFFGTRDFDLLPGSVDERLIKKSLPRAEVFLYPDASHWILHEKPFEVAHGIREHLKRILR